MRRVERDWLAQPVAVLDESSFRMREQEAIEQRDHRARERVRTARSRRRVRGACTKCSGSESDRQPNDNGAGPAVPSAGSRCAPIARQTRVLPMGACDRGVGPITTMGRRARRTLVGVASCHVGRALRPESKRRSSTGSANGTLARVQPTASDVEKCNQTPMVFVRQSSPKWTFQDHLFGTIRIPCDGRTRRCIRRARS